MKDLAKLIVFVLLISIGLLFVFKQDNPIDDGGMMAFNDEMAGEMTPMRELLPQPGSDTDFTTASGTITGSIESTDNGISEEERREQERRENMRIEQERQERERIERERLEKERKELLEKERERNRPKFITYTVKSGDTLSSISEKFIGSRNSWQTIYDLNKDVAPNPSNIKLGTTLKIPVVENKSTNKEVEISKPISTPSVEKSSKVVEHKIASGDSFYKLAKKYYNDSSKYQLIEKANPNVNSSKLKIGQIIKIPVLK